MDSFVFVVNTSMEKILHSGTRPAAMVGVVVLFVDARGGILKHSILTKGEAYKDFVYECCTKNMADISRLRT